MAQIGGLPFANVEPLGDTASAVAAPAADSPPPEVVETADLPTRAAAASIVSPAGEPRAASVASPAPLLAASPAAAVAASPSPAAATSSSDLIAVASQTDQKLTLIDAESGKIRASIELGMPAKSMAVEPDGHTALVFSNTPGETDYQLVDLWKGKRTDSKRLHDNPSVAAFSSDGLRTFVSLSGGTIRRRRPIPSRSSKRRTNLNLGRSM
jgi:hypothetical protein